MFDDRKIELSLLRNAVDSIECAIDLIAWAAEERREERRLKQAILSIAHGIELLLKERLRRIHPALIWENVDKYPSVSARTVTVDAALLRLGNIGGLKFSDADVHLIRSLRDTRNAIEHYKWSISMEETNNIVGRALGFAVHFAENQLDATIFGYAEAQDDVLGQLLTQNTAFAVAYRERNERVESTDPADALPCSHCRGQGVSQRTGACRLCGHWNNIRGIWDDLDNELPF